MSMKAGNGLIMVFKAGFKFCKDGLGKLGRIFAKPFSGFKNKKSNPNQLEDYENPDKGSYKPGYYSIVPKQVDQKIGEKEAENLVNVEYAPEVDPLKLKR